MLELLLIRHGETDWNLTQRIMGRQPIPLNRRGRKQARDLARYLKGAELGAVYTSPVERARETAEILHRGRRSCSLIEDEGFSEIDYGEWVNRFFADVQSEYQQVWRQYRQTPCDVRFPGGESMGDAFARVAKAMDRLRAKHAQGRIAIISHADTIKFAMLHLLSLPLDHVKHFQIENCALVLIRDHPEIGAKLVHYNAKNGFGRDR